MEKKKILICGAGSIGVYVGTKLHLRNHDVKLLGRRKLRKVKETIIINEKKYEVPEKLFRLPRNYKADFIFVTTKLYDFEKMIELIRKKKIRYSKIAAIQNGLVDISKYSRKLGHTIIPVTVFAGFNLIGKEILVRPTKIGWVTKPSRTGKEISKILTDAGIPCVPKRNFDLLRAEKTIVNCCLNGLSAIENKPFCDLFKNKKIKERIHKIFEETYHILKRKYKLGNPKKIEKNMFKTWSKLKHYSSTYQDIKSKRENEIPFFNGYVVELGKKYSLPVGYNQIIINEIDKLILGKFKN